MKHGNNKLNKHFYKKVSLFNSLFNNILITRFINPSRNTIFH